MKTGTHPKSQQGFGSAFFMALTVIPKNWSQHPLTSDGAEGQKGNFGLKMIPN